MASSMIPKLTVLVVALGWMWGSSVRCGAEEPQTRTIQVKPISEGLEVRVGERLFTRYLTRSGAKPILFPLVGPSGDEVTRGFPMREATEQERNDHVHHRSFWFTHGDVNGLSFWHEQADHGVIVHREFAKRESGDPAVIVSRNDWLGPENKRFCSDMRTFRFFDNGVARWIDCEIEMKASDGDVRFGDTKGRLLRFAGRGLDEGHRQEGRCDPQQQRASQRGRVGQAVGVGGLLGASRRRTDGAGRRHLQPSQQFPVPDALARAHLRLVRGQPFRTARLHQQR